MGSRRRAQSPSSVNKTSQWQLACVFRHVHPAPRCGYKGRARANAQQLFASEPSLPQISRVSAKQSALVLQRVRGGCCPVLHHLFGRRAASSPGRFSASKREFRRAKRAPRATGVFLKMASRSCVSGCGRFLASSDGHDRCPSCLGLSHESCFHCGNMTMAMLRSRCLLARRGGIPLALPRSSSSGLRRTTSAQGQGDLRITVRDYVSAGLSLLQHIAPSGVPGWACGVLRQGGAQHLIRSTSRWQDVDHCIGGWARFCRGRFGCAASIRKSSVARVRSRTNRYAFPGHWEHRAAL